MINEQLLIAARSNNSGRVYELLNGRYNYHSNYAFHSGFIRYQDLVDINYQDEDGDTALMMACKSHGTAAVKALLEHEADINMKNNDGESALVVAYEHSNKKAVVVLLYNQTEEGININGLNYVFWKVCADGDVALAKEFLLKGADIESRDYGNNTILMMACQNGHVDIVNLLLQQGASLYAKNNDGEDSLYIAKRAAKNRSHIKEYDEIVELLSSKVAEDKNRVDSA